MEWANSNVVATATEKTFTATITRSLEQEAYKLSCSVQRGRARIVLHEGSYASVDEAKLVASTVCKTTQCLVQTRGPRKRKPVGASA